MSPFGFKTNVEDVVKTFSSKINGRTFLITGTSAHGLGASAAVALAREAPAQLILVSRNKSKVDPVIKEIQSINSSVKVIFVNCDLSDFDSVRRAGQEILDNTSIPHIDVVINNAGVMAIQNYTKDKQGYELTLSACHLGHFLLTNLIMPKILAAGAGSRIVNVTSRGHRIGPFRFDDYNFSEGKEYDPWSAYGQAKTANVLFSVELARRLGSRGIASFSVHPGGIMETHLGDHLNMDNIQDLIDSIGDIAAKNGRKWDNSNDLKTPSQGTAPIVAAALDPEFEKQNGGFVEDCQIGLAEPDARDPANATKLWTLSEQLVGQKFDL